MSKSEVDLDDKALALAAKYFGTTVPEDTINRALHEFAKRQRRLDAFDKLAAMADAGYFDELLDKKNYRP
ncbi:type II toxin-antitoxin system VapB family antitoxin [Actinoplanes sp. NPDC049596]|uniref:type II toxin-antitoxin system VapB family antitoxin n=1 Tax=unclassified Actinoplanes TaxID=2626549 RepID=UPI00342671C4